MQFQVSKMIQLLIHRGGGKGGQYRTPQAKFKTLDNKNAINPKIRGPPGNFS
jgi:hypothetical protein